MADFRRKYGIATEFEANLPVGLRLRPAAEIALYRITQEALTNVARHA